MSSDMEGRMQDQIEGAQSQNEILWDELRYNRELLAWAYGILRQVHFTKPEDALRLDEIKMLLELHGEPNAQTKS